MPEWRVPLSDVTFAPAEVDAVADAYRRGWLSQGPAVAEFERAFTDTLGSRHAIAVANGTAALHLICVGIGLAPGDEVVVPSLTFAATASAALHAGAVPVFADICPEGPWISPETVGPLIGPRTRAIINVAYGGHPGEVAGLRELARARGLTLIEDAAHALGATLGERPVGRFGTAAAFSFFANKNMPLGEGGMVITDDDDLSARIRLLRSHGLTSDTWERHRGDATEYDVVVAGFNYRLDEARAALGLLRLVRLQADNARRSQLAARYREQLAAVDCVRAAITSDGAGTSAWHIYPLVLDAGVDRATFRDALRTAGIQTSIHYPPLHRTHAFSQYAPHPLPRTEDYARRTVTIPLFPEMTEEQQGLVVEAIQTALLD